MLSLLSRYHHHSGFTPTSPSISTSQISILLSLSYEASYGRVEYLHLKISIASSYMPGRVAYLQVPGTGTWASLEAVSLSTREAVNSVLGEGIMTDPSQFQQS